MVCLITCEACAAGRHEDCTGGTPPANPRSFGGTMCNCRCRSNKAKPPRLKRSVSPSLSENEAMMLRRNLSLLENLLQSSDEGNVPNFSRLTKFTIPEIREMAKHLRDRLSS